MKAIVLVGGEGTRMRPLTTTVPKPLLPLMDRHVLDHVLDHLARHGVHEVVLSSPYLEHVFHPFIEARHGDPAITWITETHALGTGGAIVNALASAGEDPFFALNGDILTDLDLTAMRTAHEQRGAAVTIALQHVEDARAFGLVATDESGRITEFREKPEEPIPGEVNAGTYLIDPRVLGGWKAGDTISIERDIFPALIEAGEYLHGFVADPYWIDLGTPEKYLQAHFDIFEGKVDALSYPAPWIAPEAGVDLRAHLGRWVAAGAGASIGPEVRIEDSVLHEGVRVDAGAVITGSVLARDVTVGEGAIVASSVVGERGSVPAGARVTDARVDAGAEAFVP